MEPTFDTWLVSMGAMPEAGRETQPYGAFRAPVPVNKAIACLASDQHNVFTLAQLKLIGLPGQAARKRAATGRLHRIYPTVYSLAPRPLLTREGHWMAAVLGCGRAPSCRIVMPRLCTA